MTGGSGPGCWPGGLAVRCLPSEAAVAEWLAERILAAARDAIARRGRFNLVLAGGRTPLAAYARLAGSRADWGRWHLYYGDERCLPADDPGRNSRAVTEAWVGDSAVAAIGHHPIQAELGAERAADLYAGEVAAVVPFDLVLLGMGEDGHTASLFPGHAIPEGPLTMAVHGAPKPPPDRVSLTPQALAATREAVVVVTGASKRAALAVWRAGADLPVSLVAARAGAALVLDAAADGGEPGTGAG